MVLQLGFTESWVGLECLTNPFYQVALSFRTWAIIDVEGLGFNSCS